jgi:signal transduction histidine kinase
MIVVMDSMAERDFERMDVEALQMLAHQASIAIENVRLNQHKDEFLSIVSHELKTPVTSIKGFAQVLQRRLSPSAMERAGRYLDVINQQADRLTGLINDLLDLSRIQTDRFVFEMDLLDYGLLIQDVVAEMQLIAPENHIALLAPESVEVRGNANRLRQVLVNLIDNAIKYGPLGGEVRITVELADGEIATYVCDQGEGLPAEEAEQIFEPYYQIRHGRPQVKGLGLGLFISRQIVTEHGGRIWLDTTDHTSFCFTLPGVPAGTE